MLSRIRRGIAVLVATAALMVAVSCSVQVIQPPARSRDCARGIYAVFRGPGDSLL